MHVARRGNVVLGKVSWSPVKSLWWTCMACTSVIGGCATFCWGAFALFLLTTASVLLRLPLATMCELVRDQFKA